MKYILIEHADGNDPKRLRIFNTVDERARATREALIGPPDDENKDIQCPELLELAAEGIVHFEGDPSLEWIDAEVPDQNFNTPNASLPPLDPTAAKRKMIVEIEVAADFEKRLDNQWMVEREIHADRWNWRWSVS